MRQFTWAIAVLGLWLCASRAPNGPVRVTSDGPDACDPAYPTLCIPPAVPDLDCLDIPASNFPVEPPDPHAFDADHDGLGCEPWPGKS
jgi:micrococcal nuclease